MHLSAACASSRSRQVSPACCLLCGVCVRSQAGRDQGPRAPARQAAGLSDVAQTTPPSVCDVERAILDAVLLTTYYAPLCTLQQGNLLFQSNKHTGARPHTQARAAQANSSSAQVSAMPARLPFTQSSCQHHHSRQPDCIICHGPQQAQQARLKTVFRRSQKSDTIVARSGLLAWHDVDQPLKWRVRQVFCCCRGAMAAG